MADHAEDWASRCVAVSIGTGTGVSETARQRLEDALRGAMSAKQLSASELKELGWLLVADVVPSSAPSGNGHEN